LDGEIMKKIITQKWNEMPFKYRKIAADGGVESEIRNYERFKIELTESHRKSMSWASKHIRFLKKELEKRER